MRVLLAILALALLPLAAAAQAPGVAHPVVLVLAYGASWSDLLAPEQGEQVGDEGVVGGGEAELGGHAVGEVPVPAIEDPVVVNVSPVRLNQLAQPIGIGLEIFDQSRARGCQRVALEIEISRDLDEAPLPLQGREQGFEPRALRCSEAGCPSRPPSA